MNKSRSEFSELSQYFKYLPIFQDLNSQELELFAEIAKIIFLKKGEYLFKGGSEVKYFFIIRFGEIDVVRSKGGRLRKVIRFTSNQFFSEKAMVNKSHYSNSAVARTNTTLVGIPSNKLISLLKKYPLLSAKIYPHITRALSARLDILRLERAVLERRSYRDKFRIEHDFLGEREVKENVYYGIQTHRAIENFSISGIPLSNFPHFVKSLAYIKKACALTNYELGYLEKKIYDAIIQACDEVIDGHFLSDFRVDMIQGGAGTSTHMNINEVLANRASEILGHKLGSYIVHPNNHVNYSQSTNDVYPTAARITISMTIHSLLYAMKNLSIAFREKGKEFAHILKVGRTQLQDAVPMTLGQEFIAFAVTIDEDIHLLKKHTQLFNEINLGGTAIGTGINVDPKFHKKVLKYLSKLTKLPLKSASDLIEATSDTGSFLIFSSTLKRISAKVSQICNDLRLLSSGPQAGFNEINLPPVQPGSSIMPGKVNPVIPEVVNQVAFQVIGNDLAVTMAAEAGQLQLNAMEPIIIFNLFQSVKMLENALNTLTEKCVKGITANEERCQGLVDSSIAIVTALNPYIGYENSSKIAKEALQSRRKVIDLVLEKKLLSENQIKKVLSPKNMTTPQNFN